MALNDDIALLSRVPLFAEIDDDSTAFALMTRRFDIGDQRVRGLLAGAGGLPEHDVASAGGGVHDL